MNSLQNIHEEIIGENFLSLLSNTVKNQKIMALKTEISIYFLRNYTINNIEDYLKYYLYNSGIDLKVNFGEYDSIAQEILDSSSRLYNFNYSIIVYSIMYDMCDPNIFSKLLKVDSFIYELKYLFDALKRNSSALILINTLMPPFFTESGITAASEKTRTDCIYEVNHFIRNYARDNSNRFFLMDWQRYVQYLGENNSIDKRYWYLYKSPFKKAFLSYYAADITRIARALTGKAKKCLILDCDNTLWGGIVGEGGVDNIKLDNHNYPGKVFYDFQQTVMDLYKRGIIIALCSKNNEDDVWEVFDNHSCCLLKRHHFSAHMINWNNKAENILKLVSDLNIGLDSCVFIDDSPAECELVRSALPEVTVIQVPHPLYSYADLLHKEGLFDTLSLSKEDLNRSQLYQHEMMRKNEYNCASNMTEYLTSLQLEATITAPKEKDFSRIAQLTQKTNQFNLSTRRYSEQQIKELSEDKNSVMFILKAQDKFGDYGLTGVFIAKKVNNKGHIDSLMLSCRVLTRGLENVFLSFCLNSMIQLWGAKVWDAEFISTDKNKQIMDFLVSEGFKLTKENIYSISIVDKHLMKVNHIKINGGKYFDD